MDEQPAWTLDRRALMVSAGAATLAAAVPAFAADAAPGLGEWTDWESLPAYRYTGPVAVHPPAALAARIPDDPWFLIGNHRLTLFVHASGRLRLLSSARGWAAMNGLKGRNAATLTVDGVEHALVGTATPPDLTVAPGAARYHYALPGLEVTRTLAAPPSSKPGSGPSAVLVTLITRNPGTAARRIAYRETLTGEYRAIEAPWACAVVARRRRSVLSNEAYWRSFCLTDLPVPVISWLKSRKGNGTIACR